MWKLIFFSFLTPLDLKIKNKKTIAINCDNLKSLQSPSTLCSLLQMIFYLDSNNFRSFFIFTLILDSFVILRTKLQFDEIFIFDLRSNLHWINKILKVLLSARTTRRVETFELGMVINHIELDRRQSYLITRGGWFRLTLYGEWVKREDTQKLRLLFP